MQQANVLLDLWLMLENIMFAALGVFIFSLLTLALDRNPYFKAKNCVLIRSFISLKNLNLKTIYVVEQKFYMTRLIALIAYELCSTIIKKFQVSRR